MILIIIWILIFFGLFSWYKYEECRDKVDDAIWLKTYRENRNKYWKKW